MEGRVTFNQKLCEGVDAGYFTYLDYYFSQLFNDVSVAARLIAALVSRAYRYGNVMVPRSYFYTVERWFLEEEELAAQQYAKELLNEAKIKKREEWEEIFVQLPSPLLVSDEGIYFEKNYRYEEQVVSFFKERQGLIPYTEEELDFFKKRLAHYFPKGDEQIDYQKVAAANTLGQSLSIISGGPGTGKTTTVFKILLLLIEHHQQFYPKEPLRIMLAAPTGKAAARLTESINQQRAHYLATEAISESLLSFIPEESLTLHRLLQLHPNKRTARFSSDEPLPVDLLVVDEASMVDLYLFSLVVDALPKGARVLFLGDRDQLSSVEAGAVLHELCQTTLLGNKVVYSLENHKQIQRLTGYNLQRENVAFYPDYLSVLVKSYRFEKREYISYLAYLINRPRQKDDFTQTVEHFQDAKEKGSNEITLHPLPIDESLLRKQIQEAFSDYYTLLRRSDITLEELFSAFNRARLLAIRRKGPYGTDELNRLVEQTLFFREEGQYYHGLSIMITQNNYEQKLFNGDVGLILRRDGELRAYFEHTELSYSLYSLPRHEVAFAMTVHKSQGSEFDHVLLFTAEEGSPFITKELLYTGVTRAKKRVTLFSSMQALSSGLSQETERFSGIHKRLVSALSD